VVISTMVGKASKLAQGRLQTHVSEGMVDFVFLAELARELGADEALTARIRSANTARHVQMLLRQASLLGLETRLAQLAVEKVEHLWMGHSMSSAGLMTSMGALWVHATIGAESRVNQFGRSVRC
jgi:cobalamin biosynthesis protein CbiD